MAGTEGRTVTAGKDVLLHAAGRMQHGAASVENLLAAPRKAKNKVAI